MLQDMQRDSMTTFANFSMELLKQSEASAARLMEQSEASAARLMKQSADTVSNLTDKYIQASSGMLSQQTKLFELLCSNMMMPTSEISHGQASLPSPRRPQLTTAHHYDNNGKTTASKSGAAAPSKKSSSSSSGSQKLITEKDANVLRQIEPIKKSLVSLLLGEYLSDASYSMIASDMFFYLHKFAKIGTEPLSVEEAAKGKSNYIKTFYRNVYFNHPMLIGGHSFNLLATEKYGDSTDRLCDFPIMFLNVTWLKQLLRDVATRTTEDDASEDIFLPVENFQTDLQALLSHGNGFADSVEQPQQQSSAIMDLDSSPPSIDQLFRDLLDAIKVTGFISRSRSKPLNTVTDGNMKNILFKLLIANPNNARFSLKNWKECYKQLILDLFVCGFNYSSSKSKGHLGDLTKLNEDLLVSEVSERMPASFFAMVTEYLRGSADVCPLMGIARRKMVHVTFSIDNEITVCCHPTYRNSETVNLDYDYTAPKKAQTLLPPIYALPPGLVVRLKPVSCAGDDEEEENIVESSDEENDGKEEEDISCGGGSSGGDTYRIAPAEAKLESGMAWRDYGPMLSLPSFQKATVLELLKKINEKVPPSLGEHMSFVRRVALMTDIQRIHFWIVYLDNYVSNLPTEECCCDITVAADVALLNNLLSICDIMVKTVESAVAQWTLVQTRAPADTPAAPHHINPEIDIAAFYEIGQLGVFNLDAPLTEDSSTDIAVLCKLINDADDEVCVTMKASDPFRILRRGKGNHSSAVPKYSVLQYCIFVLLELYNDFKSVFIDSFNEFRTKITEFIQAQSGGAQLLGGGSSSSSGSKRKRTDGNGGGQLDKRPRLTVDE